MRTRIQILSLKELNGKSKTTGNPYSMVIAQCVVLGDVPVVGELVLPKDHGPVTPGFYDAEFGVFVDNSTKRIGGQLKQLYPVPAAAAKVA